jgi:tetratricopeptide (TPR) repeat protein
MVEEGKASLLDTVADIFEKVDKYVAIIAAIIAALTFSQGNRIISYAFVIIGYALIASFLWRVMTQRSMIRRVIATIRPLPEKRGYRYLRSQRWIAGIALVILALFSFGWVGVNGWQDYQAWCHAGEDPFCPKPEMLVIIAQFDNRGTKRIDATQRIYDRLRKELDEAGITNARLKRVPEITDPNEAREIGERRGAIFVIWGWFDDLGFKSYFTTVGEKPFILKDMELEEVPLEPPGDFSLSIREGLPAQIAYFATLTIGQVYYWDGKFELALSAFDGAIESAQQGGTSEGLAAVYFYRGYIYWMAMDDTREAIADYDKAIKLRPDYSSVYFNRAFVCAAKGNYDQAVADYTKVIELEPDNVEAYLNRGVAYAANSEYDLAMADYDKAIELRPDYSDVYFNRAFVCAAEGDYDQAIADYTKVIELEPDNAGAHFNRAIIYSEQGDYDQAVADYTKVIELEPDNVGAYLNRGVAYVAKNEYDLAMADYNRAIELKPDLAEAYFNRGVAHKMRGKRDEATRDFEWLLEWSEDEYWRKKAEEQLRELCELSVKVKQSAYLTPMPTPTSRPALRPTLAPKPILPPKVAPPAPGGLGFDYGIQAHFVDQDHKPIINAIEDLGFHWVKQQIRWADLEPSKGKIKWGEMDRLVNSCSTADIKILFSVVAAPQWARPGSTDLSAEGPPDDSQDLADFVGALAERYKGRVQAYEIWNEQNLHSEWGNESLDASRYVQLLAAAYKAIKTKDPGAIVVSGALAPCGDNPPLAIDDLVYLEQMYQAGLKNYCDAVGVHPSGYNVPPDADWQTWSDPSATFRGPADNHHHSWAFRGTMEGSRNVMIVYGDSGKRLWPTEFGWASIENMAPEPAPGYEYARDNTEVEQAQFLVRAYQMGKNWGWVGVMFLGNLNYAPVAGALDRKAAFGILYPDWSPRPAYAALRDMLK